MYKFILLIILSIFITSCFEEDTVEQEKCSIEHFEGYCLEGEACIEGKCEKLCSSENLDGYCFYGLSCIDGKCKDLCSSENTDGYCSDDKSCIEGKCLTLCSSENTDGYCSDDKSCMNGECKYDMSDIELVLKDSNAQVVASFKTKEDGKFLIKATKLQGNYTIEYKDNGDDLILRKRPGRTKYSNITLKRGKNNITTNFESIFIGKLTKSRVLLNIEDKSPFEINIEGELSVYECTPNKNIGEPVTGAEIYIAQDPSTEPMANTTTDRNGEFCLGKDCSGVKVTIDANNDKGGFAIGGYRLDKDNNKKGGFAIGGYRLDKKLNSAYELEIDGVIIELFDPILTTLNKDNKFPFNHLEIENLTDGAYSGVLYINSQVREWDYSCK